MGIRSPVVLIRNQKDLDNLNIVIEESMKDGDDGDQCLTLHGFKKSSDGKIWALISTWSYGLTKIFEFNDEKNLDLQIYALSSILKGRNVVLDYGVPLNKPIDGWDDLPLFKKITF